MTSPAVNLDRSSSEQRTPRNQPTKPGPWRPIRRDLVGPIEFLALCGVSPPLLFPRGVLSVVAILLRTAATMLSLRGLLAPMERTGNVPLLAQINRRPEAQQGGLRQGDGMVPGERMHRALSAAELVVVAVAAPLLLFPRGFLPLVALTFIAAVWSLRLVAGRDAVAGTPLDLPLLLLLGGALAAFSLSVDPGRSLPELYGITIGVAVYRAVARGISPGRGWWAALALLVASAGGVTLIGLVSTNWVGTLAGTGLTQVQIPQLLSWSQNFTGRATGMNPNYLGGTLAFLLPIPLAVLLWSSSKTRPFPRVLIALGALTVVLAGMVVLVLTQSRTGMAAFAGASLLLMGLRWRRLGYLLVLLAPVGFLITAAVGPEGVFSLAAQSAGMSDAWLTMAKRQEIWSRAVWMIQDYPFTGAGLNSFPIVLDSLYPPVLPKSAPWIPHAHNLYLHTWADLGLLGLGPFLGIWAILLWQVTVAFRRAEGLMRGAVAGLGAGFVSYLLFGLTDAIHLGTRPMPLLWVMAGLVVSAAGVGGTPRVALVLPGWWRWALGGLVLAAATATAPLWLSMAYVNLGRLELNRAVADPARAEMAYRDVAGRAEQALTWNDGNGRAHLLLGLARMGMGQTAEAVASLERAASSDPGDVVTQLRLADGYRAMGDPDRAVTHWRAAGAGELLQARGAAARKGGDLASAEEWYDLATRVVPERMQPWLDLAQLREARQRWHEAAASYGDVVDRFPAARQGYEGRARMLYDRLKDGAGAVALLDLGLARADDQKQQMYYLRSVYEAGLGNLQRAEEDVRRAIELAPDNGWYLAYLGDLYVRQKRYEEALLQYQEAAAGAADRSWIWRGMQKRGAVYAALKDWPSCVDLFAAAAEESIRQGADAKVVASNYAQLAAQLTSAGRRLEAEASYRRSLEYDPANEDTARRLSELRRLPR